METVRRVRIARYASIVYVISGIILGCKAYAAEALIETRASTPSTQTTFNLPAQPLKNALVEFGRLSRTHLLYDADLAQGVRSEALTGNYTRDEALQILLKGTGLTYRLSDADTITIEHATADPMKALMNEARKPLQLAEAPDKPEAPVKKSEEGPTELPEITVTASPLGDTSYNVLDASTATKTDTPIFDTPVSVQVVPRQVLDDQKPLNFRDAFENVSSVRARPSLGNRNFFIIRGFRDSNVYRNGLRVDGRDYDTANLEALEVLKGPAAVLYGRIEPGGLINLVTKKPLDAPYYSLEQQFGSYDFYRTLWDATGPITQDQSLSYRFTGGYQNSGSFRDILSMERYQIHPSITWRPTAATEITVDVEGLNQDSQTDFGIPVIGTRPAPIPISRSLQDPNNPLDNISNVYLGFNLTHGFNENWTLRNRFLAHFHHRDDLGISPAPASDPSALRPDNRTLDRNPGFQAGDYESYATNLDLTGKLDLWGTQHEVLAGFDYYRFSDEYRSRGAIENRDPANAIDIFNPTYGIFDPVLLREELLPGPFFFEKRKNEWYGIYFQDHITLWNKLHILGGGRYDWATTGFGSVSSSFVPTSFAEAEAAIQERKDEEFSPRVGILYQPWSWLGVYGNWAQSFGANNGISATGESLPPQTGEQYEAGIKTELFDQRLTATLAFYHLTNQNILTPDFSTPDPRDRAPIGEARSQGIELDAAGQITENLSVIGNYAFTDAKVTKDFSGRQGKRLENVPEHSGSLWLRYDVNGAGADGLSLGFGVFAAGQREGDAENTFQLPGYARLDALAAYRWKLGPSRVTAQLNIRNLLDKEYFESSDPFSNVHPRLGVAPGAPLTAIGSLRVEF